MRLWHRDLVSVLPKKQLISQWRECCAIAAMIAKNKSPNHLLVNRVLSSRGDFYAYTQLVIGELKKRNYKISIKTMERCVKNILHSNAYEDNSTHFNYFPYWHTDRYLKQCYYNLEEKFDCGRISQEEFDKVKKCVEDKGISL